MSEKKAFTEELACALQEKHKLSNQTISKWRFRRSIPAKYFDQNTYNEKVIMIHKERIMSIFETNYFNREVFAQLAGTSRARILDGKFSEKATMRFVKELKQLKLDVSKLLKSSLESDFKSLISDKRIFFKAIVSNIEPIYYTRALKFKNNNSSLAAHDINIIKQQYTIAMLQINV